MLELRVVPIGAVDASVIRCGHQRRSSGTSRGAELKEIILTPVRRNADWVTEDVDARLAGTQCTLCKFFTP